MSLGIKNTLQYENAKIVLIEPFSKIQIIFSHKFFFSNMLA